MEKNEIVTRDILVAVDVQNDFINGSLAVTQGAEVVTPINDVAEAIRKNGGTNIYTRDWHPEETPHFGAGEGQWPVHCVAGTEGAAFFPTLQVEQDDVILSKGMGQTDGYSGWEGVGENGETLETLIAPRTPNEKVRVFLGGLATDYCVKATGLDIATFFADDERVTTYLLRDAVRAVALQQADEANALKALEAAHVIAITSEEARVLMNGTL